MRALVIIDLQYDFMPGGALPVAEGNEIVPVINEEIKKTYDLVVATQDWHPQLHKSFASNHNEKNPFEVIDLHGIKQVLWPDHCVQGSDGAKLHNDLNTNIISAIFRKGMDTEVDSYSAFFDNNKKYNTGLHAYLQAKGIAELTFCGLAGDFCVAYSVNDALGLGYKVKLLDKGIRSINPEMYKKYVAEWEKQGVEMV